MFINIGIELSMNMNKSTMFDLTIMKILGGLMKNCFCLSLIIEYLGSWKPCTESVRLDKPNAEYCLTGTPLKVFVRGSEVSLMTASMILSSLLMPVRSLFLLNRLTTTSCFPYGSLLGSRVCTPGGEICCDLSYTQLFFSLSAAC